MSSVNLRPDQEELVRKTAAENGLEDVEILAQVGSIKGDNYLGVISTVTVKSRKNEKELYLILKSAHTNEHFRKHAPIAAAFQREAFIYNSIIPRLKLLQEEKAISQPFTGTAKFYGSNLEEMKESILMQNLKEYEYKLWDRMKPMNDEHFSLVFSEYAKFHAASFALKNLYPEEFEQLTENILRNVFERDADTADGEKFKKFTDMYFKMGLHSVRDNPIAVKVVEKMQENIGEFFQELKESKKHSVVVHGDSWCNNMLFKYEENQSKPSQVCFIDWQISKLSSPVQDLAYFFSVCGTKQVFPNLHNYLKQYHTILAQNLREFGCAPDEILTYEDLVKEWNKFAWYGVFMAMMVIKLMLTDSEEVPNISDADGSEGALINSLTGYQMSKTTEYEKRLCDLVEFMHENNYL